jgi:hypothetical protein
LAFGDYIAIGDAPGIRPLSGDPAQEARWIISSGAITKRSLFANEIKSKSEWDVQKLDGSALKKYYASGGDIVQSRLHGQQECDVVNNTTFFLSLNENPTSNPPDAMETCRPIIFPYKFVSEDMVGKHHSYRLADPNLKSRLHSNEKIRDGFIRLVLEGFRPSPIKVKMMPIESQIDYDGFMKKCLTEPAQVLLKLFNQDPTLWESSANIHKAFESTHKSTHAIGRFLKSSGFIRTQKNSEWGYSGLALKPENENEDEESLPIISPPTPPATPPPPPKIEAAKPVLVMKPKPVQKIASLSMEDIPKKSYLEQEKEIMDMISNMDLH